MGKSLSEERFYHDEQYILPSDEEERNRLAIQHQSIVEAFGGRLVIAEDYTPRDGDRVLDSGTGTGIWATQFVASLPPTTSDVEIVGFDVETKLFPPEEHKHLRFEKRSIMDPFPSEWKNSVAFVHQRCLITALRKEQWPQALANLYEVVQPGGVVQLGEMGSFVLEGAGPLLHRHETIVSGLCSKRGLLKAISTDLPALLKSAGFTNIQVHKGYLVYGSEDGELGQANRKALEAFIRGIWTPALKEGVVDPDEDLDRYVNDIVKESEEGARKEFVYCTAVKGT